MSFIPALPAKAGYVEIEYNGKRVYYNTQTGRLFNPDMTPVIPYTSVESREHAYETLPIVEFENELLTVDEAAKRFWQYYPDNSKLAIAEELRAKISSAKDQIREMYPDENVASEPDHTPEEA